MNIEKSNLSIDTWVYLDSIGGFAQVVDFEVRHGVDYVLLTLDGPADPDAGNAEWAMLPVYGEVIGNVSFGF